MPDDENTLSVRDLDGRPLEVYIPEDYFLDPPVFSTEIHRRAGFRGGNERDEHDGYGYAD